MTRSHKLIVALVLVISCIGCDRISKDIALGHLSDGASFELLGGIVFLTYAENAGAFLGLGAEHWALRRRVMVLEKFLAENKVINPAMVEAYDPTPEEKVAWEAERDDFIERTFSVLTRETIEIASAVPTAKVPAREP